MKPYIGATAMDALGASRDYLDHMPLIERRWLLLRGKRALIEQGASSTKSGASKWPGLPRGTKFDPTDGDLLWHLIAKIGNVMENASPHPFIHDFIKSLEEGDELNHTHPQNLPGVKQDGSASYFFHKPLIKHSGSFQKHYIWEKKTESKPVYLDGVHQGFKKIYMLYLNRTNGEKPEKTDWVLHQYHAYTDERESEHEGEIVVSKLYCDVNSKHSALQACELDRGSSSARRNNKAATNTGHNDGKDCRRVAVKVTDQGQASNLGDNSDHMPFKKRNCKRQEQKKPIHPPEASGTMKEVHATDCNSTRLESTMAGSNFAPVQSSQTTSLDHVHSNLNTGNLLKIKPEPISDFDEMPLIAKALGPAHSMVTIEQVKLEEKVPLNVLQSKVPAIRATDVPFSGCSDRFSKETNAASSSLRPRKRKKTATDSVEEALEEDAPGLLKVLVDRGIIADEIKLYGVGVGEDDIGPLEVSSDNDFQDLESVITKFFSDRASLLKITTANRKKGEKVVYCLACLISLVEQTRYLKLHKSPVEWGWCRDLQSFIFVFQQHNRIVLERPEYGFATYFFELIPSMPIDWQIKRLVTAMKINSRASLLENKPLLVGEDLTEGEARVLEEYGWVRDTGIGTMLNYRDRVVHDRWHESDSSEWRVKIGRLLMNGYNRGSVVLTDIPVKVRKYMGETSVGDDLSPTRIKSEYTYESEVV
ncbi:NAC domain-containing protein 8 [Carex littledalei]|uniref:NAC domain-containing protein 8 n=1 Tax=Carex littledalei TaxID=544730 RepID=A0A833VBH2_9POAL|nr:NAC domain-containing protein 8 [Carex littledalei]